MFHVREEVHPSIGYLRLYQTDQGLNIPQLLNDDFFEAIKLLFNARMYVSSMKLLLSFLDTIAFLDCGASGGPAFQSWLGTYVDLAPTGATAQELALIWGASEMEEYLDLLNHLPLSSRV